jgi:hypothetical protein
MNTFAFVGPVNQMRRSLFILANACGICALSFLANCIVQGRLITYTVGLDIMSASDFRDWLIVRLAIILLHVGGCYLCANLVVELIHRWKSSGAIWTNREHFKTVFVVFIVILACVILIEFLANLAMLDPRSSNSVT